MPRSRSRVIASAVIITIVIVRITPIRPGHDVVLRDALGVVAAVHAHLERRLAACCRRRAARSGRGRAPCWSSVRERRQRVAGRRRIGGVGLDQQHRPLAAHELAREIRRDRQHELHLAARQQRARPRPRCASWRRRGNSRCSRSARQKAARERLSSAREHRGRQRLADRR